MPPRTGARSILFSLLLLVAANSGPWSEASKESNSSPRERRQACNPTSTTVNGQPSCSGRLVFEDNFDGPRLDPARWRPDVMIAGFPDHEFVWFTSDRKNLFIRNGVLFLKPTLVSAANDFLTAGILDLSKRGCTGEEAAECVQKAMGFNILPPAASARIRSKGLFSFRYGVVEIRAKLPDGFWLYPELYLEPAESAYGRELSGRAVLGLVRGNGRLRGPAGEEEGARRLEAGLEPVLAVGPPTAADRQTLRRKDRPSGDAWNADFHTFRFKWTPDGVTMQVDGQPLGQNEDDATVAPPPLGFGQLHSAGEAAWAAGGKMAPFDKEFYLTLGLGVGGGRVFPDNSTSAGRAKPWKNVNVKARLEFLRDKATWRDTWAWDDAALQVDYVKVWAL